MILASKLAGRWGVVGGLMLVGLFLAGCKGDGRDPRFSDLPGFPAATAPVQANPVPATPAGATVAPVAAKPVGITIPAAPGPGMQRGHEHIIVDVLNPGDAVTISITDIPVPIPEIQDRIKDDGTITLLQNQTFVAKGKTRGALAEEIRKRYVPDFFKQMTVNVKKTEQTQFYYVGGEVKAPGRQVYISRITVIKAIQSAGDFTDFAKKTAVQLTRMDGTKHIINCKKALKDPQLDLEVFPGDTIRVPRSWF